MLRKNMSAASYPMLFILIHSLVFSPFPAKAATSSDYQAVPPFVTAGVPPLVMLVMGRNHKLYYEAYNDASDLDGDDNLDVGYNPSIDYYGYFDSYKYYKYVSGRFEPKGETSDKKAAAGDYWSGDFLNYLTMSRMDCLRKVLYGGFRYTDTATETVLERSFIPQDAHSWGKEYHSVDHDGYDIQDYTPLGQPKGDSHHLFASTSLSNTGAPLLRVLEDSVLRIWEWVAIERPVAGDQGNDGSGRRSILDNNVSGGVVDVTTSGTAGTIDDSYVGGVSEISINDDFDDNSLAGWQTADNETHTGTSFDETGGQLIIKGAGADVWNGSDEFAAVYLDNISGNFDFRLKVDYQQNTNGWAKTGIMVRNDMTRPKVSTGYCMIAVTPSSGFVFQWDSDADGDLDRYSNGGSVTLPKWVRLTKVGQVFTGYYSDTDSNWTQMGTATLTSADTIQDVGIFATSHTASTLSECKYGEMSIIGIVEEPDPELAFDDDDDTLWIYPEEPDADTDVWIQFQFPNATEIKSYSINGGTDAPDDWTLQGSNDGTSWTKLDTVTNAALTSGTAETFQCDETGDYTYYRINISGTSNAGVDGVYIREIEMMEDTEPIPANATLTDYTVRVKVCDASVGVESNSKLYPSGDYKPIGLLQRHGESDRMYFGLMSGSYTKNTSGGVLRKNIRSITDEIDADTGQFLYKTDTSVNGIIKTIDLFRIVGFDYGDHDYNSNCGWITTKPMSEGKCRMWGNPVAEMMYETLRYFSGAKTPTSDFTYDTTSTHDDNDLGLPKPDWLDPYTNSEDIDGDGSLDTGEDINANGELDGFDYCAKPFMLVLSDINPTYDSDQLPGSDFNTSFSSSSLGDLDVGDLANTITTQEGGFTTHFIGKAASYDGACTPKEITSLGSVRGLCPEEPTKQGSYYSASVAYYGNKEDLHGAADQDQSVVTYCVGLASPLPQIEITVGTNLITLVPFAKSVGGSSISADEGEFQPTNTIVDFFVEEITSTSGKFRINYEDVEQGADHDMDAIVEYIYQVQDSSGNPVSDPAQGVKVEISLNSTYAAGSIQQHMGYIISGTTKDGTYLEVRDEDTGEGSDPNYFLDTPPGEDPGGDWNDKNSDSANIALPLTTTRTFTPGTDGTTATLLKNPLWYAAKWGGFEDYDDDGYPNQDNEWDSDSDGTPDTYFYVQNPLDLEEELNRSFADILRRTASGTSASVISQTRSGEGAVYQAVFYPEFEGSLGNTINWAGQVHSMFVDSYGNMREDTNQNATLDLEDDRIIVFDGSIVKKYHDSDGDEEIETDQSPEFSGTMTDINFVWSSSAWLNEMEDSEVTSQRIYTESSRNRYIFTFIDEDGDMVPDDGEQQDFVVPTDTDTADTSTIFPYLNIYSTFDDEPSVTFDGKSVLMNTFRSSTDPFQDFVNQQSYRMVNYIRGMDQDEYVSGTTPSYTLPAFRSRQVDYDDDGTLETWRMGDIVYSTPTVVGTPAENYHLLYRDTSYAEFAAHFQNRRNVVYVGANDGMIHAFNGGFYDDDDKEFKTKLTTETEYQLGSEMWAYIPFNLLPHLYWLTESSYSHVYYCDLKPKIFEAKILPDNTHYTDTDAEPNWGTFLVMGMRFGGGQIQADLDKTDKAAGADDPVMSSAYVIMDITDPELPPKVMAEIKLEGMGYTTCYPTVVPMKDKDATTGTINENDWYLLFGSGPASSAGVPDGNGESGALDEAVSKQKAKLYVVDLKELGLYNTVKTLDASGTFTTAIAATETDVSSSHDYYVELDENSFVSDPITVDYNLDYNADVVYFGTVAGYDTDTDDADSGWSGKMRRMVFDNELSSLKWEGDSVFFEAAANQTIVAAASVGIDENDFRWVYFGTGRFFTRGDASISANDATTGLQSYYAIKEPFTDTNLNGVWDDETELMTWGEVSASSLLDVSNADVYDDKKVTGLTDIDDTTAIGTWAALITAVDESNGWHLNFEGLKERNLGQATLYGELLTFTTYTPSDDICSFEGTSNLYAVYYKTGTAYYLSVIGSSNEDRDGDDQENDVKITRVISLGDGLSLSPNIHVGSQEGSKAFVQTSTGAIETIEQVNPGDIKSGIISWEAVD